MGYLHIDNLYKDQRILAFRECYALEKVHGTSAEVAWRDGEVHFSVDGLAQSVFAALFDAKALAAVFWGLGFPEVTVYGEAYGGNCQRMRDVYGDELRFIVFDVQIGDVWLAVPDMAEVAAEFGLEVVPWIKVDTSLKSLDKWRDAPSDVARQRRCGVKQREGIVLRPIFEAFTSNGKRIITKHRAPEFRETRTPRPVDAAKLQVLEGAKAIADEWVTEMRLTHVLGAFPDATIKQTGDVVRAMIADVEREAEGEIVVSKDARKAIGSRAASMFKARVTAVVQEKP